MARKSSRVLLPREYCDTDIKSRSTFTAERASRLGWKPVSAPDHILVAADAEVELILKHSID